MSGYFFPYVNSSGNGWSFYIELEYKWIFFFKNKTDGVLGFDLFKSQISKFFFFGELEWMHMSNFNQFSISLNISETHLLICCALSLSLSNGSPISQILLFGWIFGLWNKKRSQSLGGLVYKEGTVLAQFCFSPKTADLCIELVLIHLDLITFVSKLFT